jgi:predicted dithiol-disulfide oxidoreductase (DUF899 family)
LRKIAARQHDRLVARKELLAEEKALTRARDALSAQRRRLPMMVEIEKDYAFEAPEGTASQLDLFEGRGASRVQRPAPSRVGGRGATST